MRSLQTAVPLGVWRSSGSLVKLPTRTTRLTLAIPSLLSAVGLGLGILTRAGRRRYGLFRAGLRGAGRRTNDAPDGEVAYDSVGDLEDARDLVKGRGLGREGEQVVRALALVIDLVGEAAPAPRPLGRPRARSPRERG